MNDRQHAPFGELPSGVHRTHITDPLARDNTRLQLYRDFLRLGPGDLVFDIGANVGEVTRVLVALGCKVVAVEPQEDLLHLLGPGCVAVHAAVGLEPGEATLYRVRSAPALSTMRADFVAEIERQWGQTEACTVPVITLDDLIVEHGVPAFCKIDVEGHEIDVLSGLSVALPKLSFEVHSFDRGKIPKCFELLDRLGEYRYTYSQGESFVLEMWPPDELRWFGDVYAILAPE